jgi:hypothetical protein
MSKELVIPEDLREPLEIAKAYAAAMKEAIESEDEKWVDYGAATAHFRTFSPTFCVELIKRIARAEATIERLSAPEISEYEFDEHFHSNPESRDTATVQDVLALIAARAKNHCPACASGQSLCVGKSTGE